MNLDTILNIMNEYKLTADEVMLVYLTFISQTENAQQEKGTYYFKKWFDGGGNERLKDLFKSLKDKGIIHKNYCPTSYIPDEIEFNKNFLKKWIKYSGELGQELFNTYPAYITINGKMAPLRNISKQFHSLDAFYFHYATLIGHDKSKHKEIMELLKWGKERNLITYSILEFIASQKWLDLKELKESGSSGHLTTDSIYLDD